jgi:hypothetical protein
MAMAPASVAISTIRIQNSHFSMKKMTPSIITSCSAATPVATSASRSSRCTASTSPEAAASTAPAPPADMRR